MDSARNTNFLRRGLSLLLKGFIRGYQLGISPLLGPRCRFYPTCSNYALEAIAQHGPFKGGWLALRRLAKCHPWHDGGVDLVPHSGTPPHSHDTCSHGSRPHD